MNVTTFIARRYLRPRRLSFVGIVGLISVFGIVVGTAALIIVMSLFNGFRGVARDLMTSFGPHIRITGATFTQKEIDHWNMSRVWLTKMVVQAPSGMSVVYAQGNEIGDERVARPLKNAVIFGTSDLASQDLMPHIVVSLGVAQNLQLMLGDTVTMLSPEQIESSVTGQGMPTGARAIVGGVFQSNSSRDIDASYVFCSSSLISRLTGRPATTYDIRLDNPDNARDTAQAIAAMYSLQGFVQTWEDLNRGIYDTMKLERLGSFIVLLLIVVVAAFNIVISLTMGVVEKQRDIVVLKTMGCTNAMIRSIYLKQGLSIGLVSVFLGTLIGISLCLGQIHFQWIAFDMSQGFLIPALPMKIDATDITVVAGTGLVLAMLAAWYPAALASKDHYSASTASMTLSESSSHTR